MTNEEILIRFQESEEFEITGNDRLKDGIYKFFKGTHPATESYMFLRKKTALGSFQNAPYNGLQAAMLNTVTDEWVTVWVEMGDLIYILKNQIEFL